MLRKKRWLLILLGVMLGLIYGLVSKAWPAENAVQEKEDYTAIMGQAENWPVIDEGWAFGTLGKLHEDPQNSDRAMLSVWFVNKFNNDQLEMFAKILFLKSIQKAGELNKSLAAMLKKDDNLWAVGDCIRTNDVMYNGERAIAFRLFGRHDSNNPAAIKIFLLKDLVLSK